MKKQVKMCYKAYASKDDIFKEWKGEGEFSVGKIYVPVPENDICYGFKINKQGLISINNIEAEVVREIFYMHLFGISAEGISQRLKEYEPQLIQGILCDERYAGYIFITENDVIVAHWVSKAIIPKGMFAIAQELQSRKMNK